MKKLRGKLIMAAVILSCGIAMHADPPSRSQAKKVAALTAGDKWQMLHATEAAARSTAASKNVPPHGQELP